MERNYPFRVRFNQHMHSRLATRYHRLTMMAAVVAALSSSAALATLTQDHPTIGAWLVAFAAVSAAVSPVLNWHGKYAMHAGLFMGYRMLELRMDGMSEQDLAAQYRDMEQQEPAEKPALFARLSNWADATTRRELGYS